MKFNVDNKLFEVYISLLLGKFQPKTVLKLAQNKFFIFDIVDARKFDVLGASTVCCEQIVRKINECLHYATLTIKKHETLFKNLEF